jgi:glycosyltransferase involved in cell wall biosynthesis
MSDRARVAVIVPSRSPGEFVAESVRSVIEPEPVEIVIVDDGSADEETHEILRQLESDGYRVVRLATNRGNAMVRNAGVESTRAPYLFPLDPGNLASPGALGRMANRLDSHPEAGACMGDYEEFEVRTLVRTVPKHLDPYRVAYTNEYPPAALFRRSALQSVGGWTRLIDELDARADWNLWMSLAERGLQGAHFGGGELTYLRRMHGGRLASAGRSYNLRLYSALRDQHPELFSRLREHRAASDLGPVRARLYPVVYGRRPRVRAETIPKAVLDKLGIWTLTGKLDEPGRRQIAASFTAAEHRRPAPPPVGKAGRLPRVAVLIPCHQDGDFVADTVRSIDEPEPIELVVVDDGSPDAATHAALDRLEADGHRVIRLERNQGVSAARNAGLEATAAPYVFPLDADDLAIPGVLSRMADRLERSPTLAACFGDYVEFRLHTALRTVPERLDPYRLAYTNEYPQTALFRRETIETIGGWRELGPVHEDYDLWMTFAEREIPAVHLGAGEITYRRRMDPERRNDRRRAPGGRAHAVARAAHPGLFARIAEHRRHTDMGLVRRTLYPLVHGGGRKRSLKSRIQALLERLRSQGPRR